ncbi:hypothetical protein HanRHA438_Chr01g0045271 [Helianthus annuus]|nr:hypothetical protein HanRHA438_Chr01g0045271 [Helianthus annuus]
MVWYAKNIQKFQTLEYLYVWLLRRSKSCLQKPILKHNSIIKGRKLKQRHDAMKNTITSCTTLTEHEV